MLMDVVERLVGLLAGMPDPVLSPDRLAARRPANASDVPAVAIGLDGTRAQPRGFGRELGLERNGRTVRHGDVYSGRLELELWAANPASMATLAGAVERRLSGPAEEVRARGFIQLEPSSLLPAERVLLEPAPGSAFPAWRQRLEYRYSCEIEEPPPEPGVGSIRRVDVEMDRERPDSFSVTG